MRGNACGFQHDSRDRLGCSDSLSGSMSLPLAGGSAYVGYTRRQTWRPAQALPGFDEDPLEGLLPWLPPDPLRPRREAQRSRTWQASYSRTDRWGEFSVSSRAGLQPEPPAERRARQLAAPLRRGRAPTRTPAAGRDLQRGAEPAAGGGCHLPRSQCRTARHQQ
ncbi:hypothetical protein G6F22_018176 [Rhizopus arrhizus]|nr:hypothetical protein G6F22_018176 [Rhizopus arrhizus]